MMRGRFADQHEAFNALGYSVTNEEPELFRHLIGRRKFKRGAGIVSGGEIPLFVLLMCCDEVVGIDHSYRSLAACWTKMLLLDALGAKRFKSLFVPSNFVKLQKEVVKLNDDTLKHLIAKGKLTNNPTLSDYTNMRREVAFTPLHVIDKAVKRLDRVQLVHGDLVQDLPKYGVFDVLYISNVPQHADRTNKFPTPRDMCNLVTPRGTLLSTGYVGSPYDPWKPLKSVFGYRTGWNHYVHQAINKIETQTTHVEAKPVEAVAHV